MNNFNDYYNYPNNNYNDMNFIVDPNNMIYDMNYQTPFQNTFTRPNAGSDTIKEKPNGKEKS